MKYQLVLVLLCILNIVKMQKDLSSYPYSLVNATNMQVFLNNSVLNNILNEFVQTVDGQKITQNQSYVIINLNNSFKNPTFTLKYQQSASELTLTHNQNFDITVQVNSTFRQRILNVTLQQMKIQFINYFGDLQMNCTSLKFNYNSSLFSSAVNLQVNELQNSFNNQFLKLLNNWKGKKPQITNIDNYDLGIFYSQNEQPLFKNDGMFLNMGNLIVHNYEKVTRNIVDQFLNKYPCADNKCDCQNQNSIFISENLINTYFQSAFNNQAFKISMKSSQIQLWLQWLGVNINNIDVGFIKTLYPSSDTELDDSTLLDLDFQANDVPVIEFGNDFLQSNLQFTLTFSNQGVKLMTINCAIKVFFMFKLDQQLNLDINDIQFMIKTLQIVNEDGKLELQSQGLTQVASSILQVIAPAIINNVNLNGISLNQIFGFNTFRFIQPQITSVKLVNDYIAIFFDPKETKFNAQDFINTISKEQN